MRVPRNPDCSKTAPIARRWPLPEPTAVKFHLRKPVSPKENKTGAIDIHSRINEQVNY
jgi:hypothetical protein